MSAKRNTEKKKKTSKESPARKRVNRKDSSQRWKTKAIELLFLLLLFFALFLTISLTTDLLGQAGADVSAIIALLTFGQYGTLVIPAIILLVLIWWLSNRKFKLTRWVVGLITAGFFTGFGMAFVRNWIGWAEKELLSGFAPFWLAQHSEIYLHRVGTLIVSLTVIIALAVILFNFRFSHIIGGVIGLSSRIIQSLLVDLRKRREAGAEEISLDGSPEENDLIAASTVDTEIQTDEQDDVGSVRAEDFQPLPETSGADDFEDGAVKGSPGPRELPPLKLLDLPPPDSPEVDPDEMEENAARLEEKLSSMRISARVIKTNPGPIITRYDLEPASDVKIARIVSLTDDIAMALKAKAVRIQAPIPGEAAVGIEIPNRKPQTVYIREIISSEKFRQATAPLTIALGKDTNGGIFCVDLATMPHLLIAGATGSGKSVCMNTIITSLLYRSDPKDVRLIMIDPKKIELSMYSRLHEQHLVYPPGLGEQVITEPENAVKTLQSLHVEMDRRYSILADAGVRSLEEYNNWIDTTAPEDYADEEDQRERLPFLIVIIDELADLMITVRRDFEELVARLAQMARAVGIHLIVATQRPSVDVVTGLIKANFPVRIAFRVATKVDSRTIIDGIGAEAMLGRGDMLLMGFGSKVRRLHGALITTEEIERVIEFVRAQPPIESSFKLPDPEIQRIQAGVNGFDSAGRADNDELFEQAAKIVVRTEQGSVSVLQRRLRVGYARAARLIDQLEQAGIVGPFDGSKARQVMVTAEELNE
ncbi:DUF87 domain-containing protein [bacterium]|nr:DUF87 domain-containing protein [bacterium]